MAKKVLTASDLELINKAEIKRDRRKAKNRDLNSKGAFYQPKQKEDRNGSEAEGVT